MNIRSTDANDFLIADQSLRSPPVDDDRKSNSHSDDNSNYTSSAGHEIKLIPVIIAPTLDKIM